jgi:hypothetical protein
LKATIGIPRPTTRGAQASNNEDEFEEEDMGLEGEEENAAAVAATATASEDADGEPSQPQSQTSAEEAQQRMAAELEALVKEKQQVESELRREVREAKVGNRRRIFHANTFHLEFRYSVYIHEARKVVSSSVVCKFMYFDPKSFSPLDCETRTVSKTPLACIAVV